MNSASDKEPETYRAEVDQQDGGPASHQEDGGSPNDVASGGISEYRNEDDDDQNDNDGEPADQDHDVHGDTDTVN